MEYTKGEWKYTRPQIGTSGKIICTMIEPHYMPDCGDNTWYNGQVEVMNNDAHMMAAAPDMYEALKAAKEVYEDVYKIGQPQYAVIPFVNERYQILLKALAKAEGKV